MGYRGFSTYLLSPPDPPRSCLRIEALTTRSHSDDGTLRRSVPPTIGALGLLDQAFVPRLAVAVCGESLEQDK